MIIAFDVDTFARVTRSRHRLTIRAWCRCGGSVVASASPEAVAGRVYRLWRGTHQGEECEPCDARTAQRVRSKSERVAR